MNSTNPSDGSEQKQPAEANSGEVQNSAPQKAESTPPQKPEDTPPQKPEDAPPPNDAKALPSAELKESADQSNEKESQPPAEVVSQGPGGTNPTRPTALDSPGMSKVKSYLMRMGKVMVVFAIVGCCLMLLAVWMISAMIDHVISQIGK